MADIDFTNRDPMWVRYAENTVGNHDKFYEARVDQGDDGKFYLTKRWGRNPSLRTGGQDKQEQYVRQSDAVEAGRTIFLKKVDEGYVEDQWPHGTPAIPDLNDTDAVKAWLDA